MRATKKTEAAYQTPDEMAIKVAPAATRLQCERSSEDGGAERWVSGVMTHEHGCRKAREIGTAWRTEPSRALGAIQHRPGGGTGRQHRRNVPGIVRAVRGEGSSLRQFSSALARRG